MSNKFIYLLNDYKFLKAREVGIIESETKGDYIISFVTADESVTVPKSMVKTFDPKETGDDFPNKICNRCNRLLEIDSFKINQTAKDNRIVRRPSCNDCRKIIDGKKVGSKDSKEWAKTKPNFEIWECPICKKKTIPGVTSKVVLDHNHNTGKPRAWICDSCNTGLGRFKDNTEIMLNAIKYLESK